MPMTATLTGAGAAISSSRRCVSVACGCLVTESSVILSSAVRELDEERALLLFEKAARRCADQILVSFRVARARSRSAEGGGAHVHTSTRGEALFVGRRVFDHSSLRRLQAQMALPGTVSVQYGAVSPTPSSLVSSADGQLAIVTRSDIHLVVTLFSLFCEYERVR